MHWKHQWTYALAAALLLLATGCLSIGGKTYSTDSPDIDKRLSSLEARVGVLERALNGVPPTGVPGVQAAPSVEYLSPSGRAIAPGLSAR
jgi:hypothetical protein